MPRDLLETTPQSGPRDLLADSSVEPSNAVPRGNAYDKVKAFSNSASNAALFNFGDEASAALGAATVGTVGGLINAAKRRDLREIPRAQGQTFKEFMDISRNERDANKAKAPIASTAGEITGAVVGGAKTAGLAAQKLGQFAGTVRGAATIGGAEGAAFGAGSADGNVAERADDAAVGAAFGAVGGAAFQKLANGVQNFWRARAGKQVATPETKKAFDLIRRTLSEDKGSKSKAEAFLRTWMKGGAKPDELFDELASGGRGKVVAREMATRNPQDALKFIEDFRAAQGEKIRDAIGQTLKNGRTVKTSREALQEVRQVQAKPLYDEAFSENVFSDEIADIIESRPIVKQSIRRATTALRNRGGKTSYQPGVRSKADDLLERALHIKNAGKGSKPVGLADFVRQQGGVRDVGGDVLSSIGNTVKGRPGLVNNSGGKQIDDLIIAAQEAGYFPGRNLDQGDIPSQREFLDALADDVSGRRVFTGAGADDAVSQQGFDQAAEELIAMGVDPRAPKAELIRQVEAAAGEGVSTETAPTIEVLDRAKGYMDDRIGALLRQGKKREAGDIIAAKKALVDRIDELNPTYRTARQMWAGTAEIEDAMEIGRKFTRPSYRADELISDLAKMNESQREFHKVAVAEELEALIEKTRDNSNSARFVQTEQMRAKLRALFADAPEDGEKFVKLIEKSAEQFTRRAFVDPGSGSQTQQRQRANELIRDAAEGRIARAGIRAAQNPIGIPAEIAGAARRQGNEARAQRISEIVAQALFRGADDPFARNVVNARVPVAPELAAITQNRE